MTSVMGNNTQSRICGSRYSDTLFERTSICQFRVFFDIKVSFLFVTHDSPMMKCPLLQILVGLVLVKGEVGV